MAPLLPEMIRLMPGCSVQDLCELLHGLASTHITDRALLEAWSSNFVHKALERAEFDAAGSGETIRLDLNPRRSQMCARCVRFLGVGIPEGYKCLWP
eukprot:g12821.t1